MAERREAWSHGAGGIDPRRLVFLDESGAKTNMTRTYGWAHGGELVVEATPHGHWQTTTMLETFDLSCRYAWRCRVTDDRRLWAL